MSVLGILACDASPTGPSGDSLQWTFVAAGGGATCAIDTRGDTYCWGGLGTVGFGPQAGDRYLPERVATPAPFVTVSVGASHACGLTGDGVAYCWGRNTNGELSDGTEVERTTPVPAQLPGPVRQVEAGDGFTCAVLQAGPTHCWGGNRNAELGRDADQTCGSVCSVPGDPVDEGRIFSSISLGLRHACGIEPAGDLYCWGWDQFGQVGRGPVGERSSTSRSSPVRVGAPGQWTSVSAGVYHSCGVRSAQTLCWGSLALHGEAVGGIGSSGGTDEPRPFSSTLSTVTLNRGNSFLAGNGCGLTEAGRAFCWGLNPSGMLGLDATAGVCAGTTYRVGCTPDPQPVDADEPFRSLALGAEHVCGLTESGRILCWGSDARGQLGGGGRGSSSQPFPVRDPAAWGAS